MQQASDIDIHPQPESAVAMSFVVPYYRSLSRYGEFCNLNKSISMLHPDVLAILYHLSRYTGEVLELGPYVGGSTIAMGWSLKDAHINGRIVSVEVGGSYDHPTWGTDNILRDLHKNLEHYQVSQFVDVIEGDSRDPTVVQTVKARASSNGYGLMFVDTDGRIKDDFDLYRDALTSKAYIVVDDYFAPGAPEKVGTTRAGLLGLVRAGIVECLGIYGWGTWVGRLTH
jgi:predicted O-methyltransferase YrrM